MTIDSCFAGNEMIMANGNRQESMLSVLSIRFRQCWVWGTMGNTRQDLNSITQVGLVLLPSNKQLAETLKRGLLQARLKNKNNHEGRMSDDW